MSRIYIPLKDGSTAICEECAKEENIPNTINRIANIVGQTLDEAKAVLAIIREGKIEQPPYKNGVNWCICCKESLT